MKKNNDNLGDFFESKWFKERPEKVQDFFRKYPPGEYFRKSAVDENGDYYYYGVFLIGCDENASELKCSFEHHDHDHNQKKPEGITARIHVKKPEWFPTVHARQYQVFGIDPETLYRESDIDQSKILYRYGEKKL